MAHVRPKHVARTTQYTVNDILKYQQTLFSELNIF
jgi:hypothetical protein